MLKKIMVTISIIVVCILALVFVGALWMRSMMSAPLYNPGSVRAAEADPDSKISFNPTAPITDPAAPWLVEPGIELAHFETGTGTGTPVLVIHGGPGFPFAEPIPALDQFTNDHRFVYYDQRGCGNSSRPVDTFTSKNFYNNLKSLDAQLGLGAQIADIERIRRILKTEKLIIIGHSFGGFLATLYAAEFPEHVQGLILAAPADVLKIPQADGGMFPAVRAKLPAGLQHGYDQFIQDYLDFGKIFTKSEADLQKLNWRFGEYYFIAAGHMETLPSEGSDPVPPSAPGWMVQAMYLSMGKKHDYRLALTAVELPVLVLHGQDDLTPVSASEQYLEWLPSAELKVIEDAQHDVFTDQPDQFAAAVAAFLTKLKDG